jgi:hypothetical protein
MAVLNYIRSELNGQRILPWMLEWPTNNSATACMQQCAEFGYPAAGVEVGFLFSVLSKSY